ncbi:cytidine deaminase-like protein [Annulohypoxylon maeteangense]|uniref:cytidine deaminase-like protein n=1 Tax=Annulohypoxylon maeteangense TaxID=1927788 RepID=UPI002007D346|nr:cytidine deaminase-like protein [Annulohypoxylon maeteangense]KAI0885638.1 cytidine deaminase-like protein [Annulohypoxylon maeteangense]
MLIGICGAKCAGKSTVAQYLIDHHGFKKLYLEITAPSSNASLGLSGSETDAATPDAAEKSPPQHLKQTSAPYSFSETTELLDFVTKYWRSRWVTTDIHDETVLETLSRRPFFILISVDAPLTVRWQRYQRRSSKQQETARKDLITLEDFVSQSDQHLYDATYGVLPLMSRAAIRLLNTSSNLAHLYATLGKLDLTNPDRLRPSWDSYFMSLASLAAHRCNCMKRAVGCVLVDSKHHVISTGYNGTPRHLLNCGEGGCPRCNAGESSGVSLSTCLCLHAEENALLEAGRERIRDGSILYCNTCPCLTCSIKIVQVGISEVVYSQGYSMDTETAQVFRNAGIKLRQFSPPANGLVHLEKMDLY